MRQLKKLWTRKNWWLAVLLALELLFLGGRLAADWGAGSAIHVTPDLIIPYADKARERQPRLPGGKLYRQFATTRWLDLEPGSYQVVVHYVNNGKAGSVKFLDEIMPTAPLRPGDAAARADQREFFPVDGLWLRHRADAVLFRLRRGGSHLHHRSADRAHPLVRLCAFPDGARILCAGGLHHPADSKAAALPAAHGARAVQRGGHRGHRGAGLPAAGA